jgi:DNA-3-methyladenine glycosylase II
MPRIASPRDRLLIETEEDIRAGVRALRRKCPHLRQIHKVTGDPPLRRRQPGLEGLARIVVGQQLSTASANAIWSRFRALIEPFDAESLLAAPEEGLRGAGLSGPKIRTLRAVASAVAERRLDLEGLIAEEDEAVHAALTAVSGLGPWTADIFLMFCLGRRDAFAASDLALQVAAAGVLGIDRRPSPRELIDIAECWRPWRGVAARLLWAYYPVLIRQKRSGLPV